MFRFFFGSDAIFSTIISREEFISCVMRCACGSYFKLRILIIYFSKVVGSVSFNKEFYKLI
ncbi:hypothetical protein SAMN05444396_10789 [Flavobacterium segetis]|uniref:Uncharacterized protein n=1 Tax=Flavobacterium segetis TaxID=271157 RepID=A0A1M5IJY3_9FLAO|nr:hypothetical protein SAMN05444396_10789 [Flavobacterium segetis]